MRNPKLAHILVLSPTAIVMFTLHSYYITASYSHESSLLQSLLIHEIGLDFMRNRPRPGP